MSNEPGFTALSRMSKRKPTSPGPMSVQPVEHGSIVPTQLLPAMPTAEKKAKAPLPKKRPTREDAIQAAKARLMRRNSLQKQRRAQRTDAD